MSDSRSCKYRYVGEIGRRELVVFQPPVEHGVVATVHVSQHALLQLAYELSPPDVTKRDYLDHDRQWQLLHTEQGLGLRAEPNGGVAEERLARVHLV